MTDRSPSMDHFLTQPPLSLQKAYVDHVLCTIDREFHEQLLGPGEHHKMLLVWDDKFRCRAYSTERQNTSFAVVTLDHVWCNVSIIVDVSYS